MTELTVHTLHGMHTEEAFSLFFSFVERFCELTDTDLPVTFLQMESSSVV